MIHLALCYALGATLAALWYVAQACPERRPWFIEEWVEAGALWVIHAAASWVLVLLLLR